MTSTNDNTITADSLAVGTKFTDGEGNMRYVVSLPDGNKATVLYKGRWVYTLSPVPIQDIVVNQIIDGFVDEYIFISDTVFFS